MNRLIRKLLGVNQPAVDNNIRHIEKQQDRIEKELRQLQIQAALNRLRQERNNRAE